MEIPRAPFRLTGFGQGSLPCLEEFPSLLVEHLPCRSQFDALVAPPD